MDLKRGYKDTEVGVIPENWDVEPFGNVLTEFNGGAPFKPSDFTSIGVKVLPKGAVGRAGWLQMDDTDLQYCSWEYAAAHRRNQVDETFTIVVLRDLVPSGPSIGLMVQIRERETFVLAQGVYGFKVNSRAVPGYLVQLSNTQWYRKLANSIMVGSTQVHITNTAFKRVLIPWPPPTEQEAIAEALSDADALIESLEQLITKKRHLKQGAMQELLTGKERLPGFEMKPGYKQTEVGVIPGDWQVKPLGELASLYQPVTISAKQFTDAGFPVYGANGVVGFYNKSNHDSWQVTVTCRGSTCGTINRTVDRCWITGNAMVLNCDQSEHLSKEFFYHLLCLQDLSDCITGTGQPQIVRAPLAAFRVALPPTKAEQIAIATILSDMDAEIAAVKGKVAKALQFKQGMMQELLTGRIRLV